MKDTFILVYIDNEGFSTDKYFDTKKDLIHYARKNHIIGDIYKKDFCTWPHYIGYTKG